MDPPPLSSCDYGAESSENIVFITGLYAKNVSFVPQNKVELLLNTVDRYFY